MCPATRESNVLLVPRFCSRSGGRGGKWSPLGNAASNPLGSPARGHQGKVDALLSVFSE
jgi:hypothetical protein